MVLKHFNVTYEQLNAPIKTLITVIPRQMAHYLAYIYTYEQLAVIGLRFGNKNHSTVINSVKKINEYMQTDKHFMARHGEFIHCVL